MRQVAPILTVAMLGALAAPAGATAQSVSIPVPERVEALARIYGVVRFFHPSDAVDEIDWNRFAIHGVDRVLGVGDAGALRLALEELFTPLVVGLRVGETRAAVDDASADGRPTGPFLVRQHENFGPGENQGDGVSRRVRFGPDVDDPERLFSAHASFGSIVELEVAPEVHVAIPLTVNAADAGAGAERGLDALRDRLASLEDADLSPDRAAVRLAAVVVAWNALEHFYPYHRDLPVDWAAALRPALIAVQDGQAAVELETTLNDLVRPWQDGHVSLDPPQSVPARRRGVLPFVARVGENRMFVTASRDSTVLVGDEVLTIDGTPALDVLEGGMGSFHGTPRRRRAMAEVMGMRVGSLGTAVELQLRRRGETVRLQVERVPFARDGSHLTTPWTHPSPRELEPGIWYVDMHRTSVAAFDSVAAVVAAARGVIFDLRSYPAGTFALLGHLTDSVLVGPPYCALQVAVPFRRDINGCAPSRFELEPRAPQIRGRVVFLSSERSISAAETLLMTVREYRLATIVGERTAGANGGIDWITLPGGFRLYFTSSRMTRYDGTRFQWDGVAPDVEVAPTAAGLHAGRDETLDAALRWLRAP